MKHDINDQKMERSKCGLNIVGLQKEKIHCVLFCFPGIILNVQSGSQAINIA